MRLTLAIALLAWVAVGLGVWRLWPVIAQIGDARRARTFYVASESMLPTLRINDRVKPKLVGLTDFRRGMVIAFEAPDTVRLDRIVGIAGDTVAMRGGMIVLNGAIVRMRDVGAGPAQDGGPTRLLTERLPGEGHAHTILDCGPSRGDESDPVTVPADMLFVMGDNRDRSADSRYPPEVLGVGLVRANAVIGVVDRLLWRQGFRDLGRPVDDTGGE